MSSLSTLLYFINVGGAMHGISKHAVNSAYWVNPIPIAHVPLITALLIGTYSKSFFSDSIVVSKLHILHLKIHDVSKPRWISLMSFTSMNEHPCEI